jgi:hypothetical protein
MLGTHSAVNPLGLQLRQPRLPTSQVQRGHGAGTTECSWPRCRSGGLRANGPGQWWRRTPLTTRPRLLRLRMSHSRASVPYRNCDVRCSSTSTTLKCRSISCCSGRWALAAGSAQRTGTYPPHTRQWSAATGPSRPPPPRAPPAPAGPCICRTRPGCGHARSAGSAASALATPPATFAPDMPPPCPQNRQKRRSLPRYLGATSPGAVESESNVKSCRHGVV